jgi:hypothetical protein
MIPLWLQYVCDGAAWTCYPRAWLQPYSWYIWIWPMAVVKWSSK